MLRTCLAFIPQVILMAYMCFLQIVPRCVRQYLPLGHHRRVSTHWQCDTSLPAMHLSNRVAVVTGGNSGVGSVCPSHSDVMRVLKRVTNCNNLVRFAIAHQLSSAGATVILACRRAHAGEEAARRISSVTLGRVLCLQCDLESIVSVNEVGTRLGGCCFPVAHCCFPVAHCCFPVAHATGDVSCVIHPAVCGIIYAP
jgi:hypothetical protein